MANATRWPNRFLGGGPNEVPPYTSQATPPYSDALLIRNANRANWQLVVESFTLKDGHRQWPSGIEAQLPALSPECPVSLGLPFISFCHRRKARWPMSEQHLDGEELGASDLARSQAASCTSPLLRRRVGEPCCSLIGRRVVTPDPRCPASGTGRRSDCERSGRHARAGPRRRPLATGRVSPSATIRSPGASS